MILRRVPVSSIVVRPQSRRHFDQSSIREMADSIESVGLQQPLLCRLDGGEPVLIDGERRLRALQLLGRAEADALIVEGSSDIADWLTRQLVCNFQRADLRPIERAEGVKQLMDGGGLTAHQAAKRLGVSAATVSKWLPLLSLPVEVQAMVDDGRIAADAAYQLSRMKDPGEQAATAAELAEKQITRDELARKLKRADKPDRRKSRPIPRVTAALGGGRSVAVCGPGLSLDSLIDWLEPLLVRARKAKSQGLSLQTFARTLKDQAST